MGRLLWSCAGQAGVAIDSGPKHKAAEMHKLAKMKMRVVRTCTDHSLTDPSAHQWTHGQRASGRWSTGSATIRHTLAENANTKASQHQARARFALSKNAQREVTQLTSYAQLFPDWKPLLKPDREVVCSITILSNHFLWLLCPNWPPYLIPALRNWNLLI